MELRTRRTSPAPAHSTHTTGDVPGALNNLADTYEGELQIALRVMSDLIGPVLIIVMAVVVGFLLLSIFLPLFKLISSIH